MNDPDSLQPSAAQAILMKTYGITMHGSQYGFEEHRYDRFEDAINYAKRQRSATVQRSNIAIYGGHACTVLGGSGWTAGAGRSYIFQASNDFLHLQPKDGGQHLSIKVGEVVAIEISGPGTTSSNASVVGGGFGLDGAAIGVVAASLINAVTNRTDTNAFLRLSTLQAELYLHFTNIEPFALRLYLSAAVVKVDGLRYDFPSRGVRLSDEIAALKALLDEGTLTANEFQLAKAKLLRVCESMPGIETSVDHRN